jgi:hypothetical protein
MKVVIDRKKVEMMRYFQMKHLGAGLATLAFSALLAGCGGEATPEPTPTPAPPAAVVMATATGADYPAPDTATLPATTPVVIATPALPATPTISIPQVVEDEGGCAIDYDLDLAGYPDLQAKLGCAIAETNNSPVAINEFGAGPDYNRFMLWFSDSSQIYVLLPDQTWQSYADTWVEGQPELSCNPLNGPPASPPLPRRGFGKLWCTVDGLQETLGTIEREERLCQHTVVQRFEQGVLLACFEDATIRYFRLLDDGGWDLVTVQ